MGLRKKRVGLASVLNYFFKMNLKYAMNIASNFGMKSMHRLSKLICMNTRVMIHRQLQKKQVAFKDKVITM
jgi:hypothetical protein